MLEQSYNDMHHNFDWLHIVVCHPHLPAAAAAIDAQAAVAVHSTLKNSYIGCCQATQKQPYKDTLVREYVH
jgi:hypothetical protein